MKMPFAAALLALCIFAGGLAPAAEPPVVRIGFADVGSPIWPKSSLSPFERPIGPGSKITGKKIARFGGTNRRGGHLSQRRSAAVERELEHANQRYSGNGIAATARARAYITDPSATTTRT